MLCQRGIEEFLLHREIKNCSPRTLRWYADKLKHISSCLPADLIDATPQTLRQLVKLLMGKTIKVNTINGYIRTLKAFFRFLHTEGLLPTNPAANLSLQKQPRVIINTFTPEQLRALLAQCDKKEFVGQRNYCMLLLMMDTGVRENEVITAKHENLDLQRGSLKVFGKGAKERAVPFGMRLRRELHRYHLHLTRVLPDATHLFPSRFGTPLLPTTISHIIAKLGKKANIKGVRLSAHTFRHTFAKQYILAGGDAFSLQQILGHTTLEMVRNYVNLYSDEVRKQHLRFSPGDRL